MNITNNSYLNYNPISDAIPCMRSNKGVYGVDIRCVFDKGLIKIEQSIFKNALFLIIFLLVISPLLKWILGKYVKGLKDKNSLSYKILLDCFTQWQILDYFLIFAYLIYVVALGYIV